ncbi:MAG: hypothetical protein PWP64_948 [Candidatus Cloacimonadota bacterium]|nr:hypothetical protein [Candidatus Cloacimonadota bacterium]
MKRGLLYLILGFLPLLLAGQDMPFNVKTSSRYSVSSMIGKVEVDSVKYYQLRLIQEFSYRKFGLGLDLDFLFDKHYHLRESDWNHIDDILDKVYYFRYAEVGDPFFFHFGGFPVYSMGNGLVMLNYSNMYYYPDLHHNGLLLGASLKSTHQPSFELFSSDIQENNILAFSTHLKPLPDSTLKYVEQGILGLSFFADRDQYSNLDFILPDSLYTQLKPKSKDDVYIIGIDYTQPFLQKEKAEYGVYADMAHIFGNGTGFILPGIYADFNVIKVNLEYRIHGDKFSQGFFDHFYEEERAIMDTLSDGTPYVISKQEALKDKKSSYGFYGKVQATIARRIKTMFAWQNMMGNDLKDGKSMWFDLGVDTRYKRLEKVAFSYSKTNVEKLRLGKVAVPRAKLSTSVTMSLNDKRRWFFIAKYSEKYKDKEGGIRWWKDTERSFSFGVKYVF